MCRWDVKPYSINQSIIARCSKCVHYFHRVAGLMVSNICQWCRPLDGGGLSSSFGLACLHSTILLLISWKCTSRTRSTTAALSNVTNANPANMRWVDEQVGKNICNLIYSILACTIKSTRNSSGDEIANVNFLCEDIVQTLKYNRLLHKFRHRSFSATHVYKFSEITQCNGYYAVQGHSRSPILVPIESSYTTSY